MYVAAFTDATPFVNTIEFEKVETSAGEGDRLVIVNLKLTDRAYDGITSYRSDASAEFTTDASSAKDFLISTAANGFQIVGTSTVSLAAGTSHVDSGELF